MNSKPISKAGSRTSSYNALQKFKSVQDEINNKNKIGLRHHKTIDSSKGSKRSKGSRRSKKSKAGLKKKRTEQLNNDLSRIVTVDDVEGLERQLDSKIELGKQSRKSSKLSIHYSSKSSHRSYGKGKAKIKESKDRPVSSRLSKVSHFLVIEDKEED